MALTDVLVFIGVSTGESSIVRLFPRWAEILGIDGTIQGRDLPVRANADAYRTVIGEIAADERIRGALVTTHKVDVYEHACDLFAVLDDHARLCREVSCISKREQGLVGHAKDPFTAGLSLDAMLPRDYWRATGADVLCLGAGGAGTAITVRLLEAEDQPRRIVVTDRDEGRLNGLRAIQAELGGIAEVEYVCVAHAAESDRLLDSLPRGSLVINATGMGKDLPGSPLTDEAGFPEEGIVWELNYRGTLDFLRQAGKQARERGLHIHDGWRYFLHGWTEVIAEVFAIALTPELFDRLAEAAEPFRPPPPGLPETSGRHKVILSVQHDGWPASDPPTTAPPPSHSTSS
jgi:shikimate dehydrogenase